MLIELTSTQGRFDPFLHALLRPHYYSYYCSKCDEMQGKRHAAMFLWQHITVTAASYSQMTDSLLGPLRYMNCSCLHERENVSVLVYSPREYAQAFTSYISIK